MFKDSILKTQICLLTNDVPVYSCIFENNTIISEGVNNKEKELKVSGHAEINAINKAFKLLKTTNLKKYNLYTTLEPCEMCYQAIKQAKINKVYYLLENEKFGYKSKLSINEKLLNLIKIENEFQKETYSKILNNFFQKNRQKNNN
ncbi:tRNA-specific adenosine deaminase [Entomoplasma ellychniae]|uniref:tRNA-specific adenosine deaminase n=1 Tax=Entomoplasma ellychniae TaxID=2114 RepID=A0A8E2QYJ6_9MOLU|nr:nucleoside deaminase [Entomoplasma ellychniae]PPE04804.1 tRNA-specific adenosine deaminase [Entomoplasma ellychniae]